MPPKQMFASTVESLLEASTKTGEVEKIQHVSQSHQKESAIENQLNLICLDMTHRKETEDGSPWFLLFPFSTVHMSAQGWLMQADFMQCACWTDLTLVRKTNITQAIFPESV